MSLRVVPDIVASAAAEMDNIGSNISSANAKAAAPTASLEAAAADDVSAAVAQTFGQHAQGYQDISAAMERFHSHFVKAMTSTASTYTDAESANAIPLQSLLSSGMLGGSVMSGLPMSGLSLPNVNVGSLLGGLSSPNLASLQNLLSLSSLGTLPAVPGDPGLAGVATPAALVRPASTWRWPAAGARRGARRASLEVVTAAS